VLGWVFITAMVGRPMGREQTGVERLSVLLLRLREDKDRAEQSE